MSPRSLAIPHHGFHHRKPSPVAFGLVVLLHLGLVVAVGNGLAVKSALPVLTDLRLSVLEPPPLPPPATTRQPQPIDIAPPPVPMDIAPILPAVEGPTRSITPPPAARPAPAAEPAAKVITQPRIDPRRPLTQPAYPSASRRAGEQGSVELMLHVLPDGRVGEARVARSSGFHRLDEAAVREAQRAWRLQPQTEDGFAVAAWFRIAVTFRLD